MRPRLRSTSGPRAAREGRPLELVRVRGTQRGTSDESRERELRGRRRRGGRGRSRGPRPPASAPPRRSFWDWLRGLFGGTPKPAPTQGQQEARILAEFGRHYGIAFRDLELLKLALTHRSYLSVTGQGPRDSNERLEFLGDSVLGLVTSEFLYLEHPTEHEGQLTKTKSLLVSKAILSRRALAMGLGRFVLMSHSEVESGGRQRLSILADAFEAVVGAIYLDQGFEAARAFIQRWLLADARAIESDKRHTNYKSHLQEYVQSTFRTHPVYRIRSEAGPDHSKHFVVEVMVGRRTLGSGKGRNKKEAEQAAARDALDRVDTGGRSARSPEGRTRMPRTEEPARTERPRPPVVIEDVPTRTATVVESDEDDPEDTPRRRGRRGGRGRRREPGAESPAPARTPTRVAPPPPAPEPIVEEVEPLPPAYDEDENEEIGRPEGPLEERHVDPYAFDSDEEEEEEEIEEAEAPPIREARTPEPLATLEEPRSWAPAEDESESEDEPIGEPRRGEASGDPAPTPGPRPAAWGRRGRRGR